MNKLFWSLVKIRLKSLFRSGRMSNSKGVASKGALGKISMTVLIVVAIAYCAAVFFGMFGMMFHTIGTALLGTELEWFYFSLAAIISFAMSFIGSIFMTQTQLYDAKDNELLLSMPVPVKFILASRMVTLLLLGFMYESIVMIPAVVVLGMLGGFTVGSAIGFIVLIIIVPFMSIALSCVIGWLIALVTSKMKRKNLFTTVLSLVAFVVYFLVCTNLFDYIEVLINNGEQIANAIKKGFYPAYALGAAGGGNYLMIFICLAAVALVFAAVYFVLDKTFIKISTTKTGSPKYKYRSKKLKRTGLQIALIKKELSHFLASPMYIMNAAMGVIFSVVAAAALAVNGKSLVLNLTAIGLPTEVIEFFALVATLAVVSFNIVSAPSISIEGKTLWLSKSLPIDPRDILMAKVYNHFIISEIGVVLMGTALVIFIPMSIFVKVLVFLIPTVFNMFCALYGVFINLLLPKLEWVSETVAVKQGMSTLVCMFSYMGVSALYLLVYLFLLAKHMSLVTYTLIFAIFLVVTSFAIYSYLNKKGRARFEKLGQ